MTARAVVSAVRADGTIALTVTEASRCAGCAGLCAWRNPQRSIELALAGRQPPPVGTPVLVGLPQQDVLKGALLLHGLPWVALLGGAAAGALVTGTDLGTFCGAVFGLAGAIIATPRLRRRLEKDTLARCTLEPLA